MLDALFHLVLITLQKKNRPTQPAVGDLSLYAPCGIQGGIKYDQLKGHDRYHYTRNNLTLSTSYWGLWIDLMKRAAELENYQTHPRHSTMG